MIGKLAEKLAILGQQHVGHVTRTYTHTHASQNNNNSAPNSIAFNPHLTIPEPGPA